MTLIEVLAALLLMGSILVMLVSARGRLLSQHAHAVDKQQAVRAADRLLMDWWASQPSAIPLNGQGEVEGSPGWYWTTRPTNAVPEGLGLVSVQLAITDHRDPSNPRTLTRVEVLAPSGRASTTELGSGDVASPSSTRRDGGQP